MAAPPSLAWLPRSWESWEDAGTATGTQDLTIQQTERHCWHSDSIVEHCKGIVMAYACVVIGMVVLGRWSSSELHKE